MNAKPGATIGAARNARSKPRVSVSKSSSVALMSASSGGSTQKSSAMGVALCRVVLRGGSDGSRAVACLTAMESSTTARRRRRRSVRGIAAAGVAPQLLLDGRAYSSRSESAAAPSQVLPLPDFPRRERLEGSPGGPKSRTVSSKRGSGPASLAARSTTLAHSRAHCRGCEDAGRAGLGLQSSK